MKAKVMSLVARRSGDAWTVSTPAGAVVATFATFEEAEKFTRENCYMPVFCM